RVRLCQGPVIDCVPLISHGITYFVLLPGTALPLAFSLGPPTQRPERSWPQDACEKETEARMAKMTTCTTIQPPEAHAQLRSAERLAGFVWPPSNTSAAISDRSGKKSVASTAPATAAPA